MTKLYEDDLMEILGLSYKETGCCTSCHEDQNMGYDMCEWTYEGQDIYVCCDVYRALEAKFGKQE